MQALRAILVALVWVGLPLVASTASAQFRPGHIGGVIKSTEGEPIRGAVVVVQNRDATPPMLSAVSDSKGRFGLLGLRSGVWSVTMRAPGFEPTVLSWPVRSSTAGPPLDIVMVAIPGGVPSNVFDKVKASSIVEDLAKASTLLDSGHADEAIAVYRALLVKAPKLTSLHLAIGRAYVANKEPQRAVESYRTLLELEPANAKARLQLGLALAATGDNTGAADEFDRVIRESSDSATSDAARIELQRLRGTSPD